jgi:hypothetical protein
MDFDSADISKHHTASADASYPHIITIETELSHTLLCMVQLQLQISSRAPGILQVQLCIIQLLRQPCILLSVLSFDSLGVEHEILRIQVRNSLTLGGCGVGFFKHTLISSSLLSWWSRRTRYRCTKFMMVGIGGDCAMRLIVVMLLNDCCGGGGLIDWSGVR